MTEPLLSIRNLQVQFRADSGWVTAVDDVSLDVGEGDCVGIVGESGSGKSVTALSILQLHDRGTTRMPSGSIQYRGDDLLRAEGAALRRIRGREIAMIFQDPMSSLNPVLTIADQISETLRRHQGLTGAAARKRVVELLGLVRIPDAPRRADEYPHRLSGGMRQRAMIAMAIACKPRLLIADEPTTALDVTIQAQVLELLPHERVVAVADQPTLRRRGALLAEVSNDFVTTNWLHPASLQIVIAAIQRFARRSNRGLSSKPGNAPDIRAIAFAPGSAPYFCAILIAV